MVVGLVAACDPSADTVPFTLHAGPLTLRPGGFVEVIGMWRGETTGDTVSTRFGRIPLADTPSEALVSAGHSRMQLCGDVPVPTGHLSGYVETDFLDAPGQNAFRFRQYWGEYKHGGWRILGGQGWSLLRPNRRGISTESGLMNTLVVEPAYHVGLMGGRRRQVRLVRDQGHWTMAVAWEDGDNYTAKLAHDAARLHVEAIALKGRDGKWGAGGAAVVHLAPHIDWVSQQMTTHGAGPDALSTLPAGVRTYSTLHGVEARVTPNTEVYAYGGISYGARSTGNRTVRQWTVGAMRHAGSWKPVGAASLGLQYSQMDRAVWDGRSGAMQYVQASLRIQFPASRGFFARH